VQKEEPDLDDNQVVALVDLFRTDSSTAEAYMAIVRPTIHKAWLNKQLRLLGFPNEVQGDKLVTMHSLFMQIGYGQNLCSRLSVISFSKEIVDLVRSIQPDKIVDGSKSWC